MDITLITFAFFSDLSEISLGATLWVLQVTAYHAQALCIYLLCFLIFKYASITVEHFKTLTMYRSEGHLSS